MVNYKESNTNLWLWDTSTPTSISSSISSSNSTLLVTEQYSVFNPAIICLRKLSHKKTPAGKLLIIHQTFTIVDYIFSKSKHFNSRLETSVKNSNDCKNPSICSTDTLFHLPGLDQLLPIMQYVVIRAGIMYLGAELAFIKQLAPERLSLHGLSPYLMTTLQACYDQILREGSSIESITQFS
ncbi:unnamed protein product [Schistosoma turkestanicum]|nr:unnamed protein product [Schistosoma turkestanicum]